jgi:hypothetical protein
MCGRLRRLHRAEVKRRRGEGRRARGGFCVLRVNFATSAVHGRCGRSPRRGRVGERQAARFACEIIGAGPGRGALTGRDSRAICGSSGFSALLTGIDGPPRHSGRAPLVGQMMPPSRRGDPGFGAARTYQRAATEDHARKRTIRTGTFGRARGSFRRGPLWTVPPATTFGPPLARGSRRRRRPR